MVIETETYCTFNFKDGSKLSLPSKFLSDPIHLNTINDALKASSRVTVREELA
tara:strand:- start:363 stop:521 length:159 start_codon:yes stop_codon:yes gene_type:complete